METVNYRSTNLQREAETELQKFASILRSIHDSVGILISAGNSGLAMTELAKMVYADLGKKEPPNYTFPLFRITNRNWETIGIDIDPYRASAQEFLKNKSIKTVLFVDDEIGRGGTLQACIRLLFQSQENLRLPLKVFIVAESLNFKPPKRKGIEFVFYPLGQRPYGISLIAHLVDPKMEEVMRKILYPESKEAVLWKASMNILLNLPVKEYSFEKGPHWTHEYGDRVRAALPHLSSYQAAFRRYLQRLIRTSR